ncbi:MAG: Ltp family lipoprotein [Enterococcus faecalis]|nr:Ltp family lipoprotein [Enterococcus faecalis]MDU5814255.1 Ltp family lipoprotein [Enterococcus casseliflavus]
MKKVVYGLLFATLVLSGCGGQGGDGGDAMESSSSSTIAASSEKKIDISLKQPNHDLENNKFSISGKTEPDTKLKLYIENSYLEILISDNEGNFSYENSLPAVDNRSYRVEVDDSIQSVMVKSKKTLELEAMSEEEKKQAEEKEKARLEALAKEEQKKKEEKQAEEKRKQEAEEKERKEKEAEEKKKQEAEAKKQQEENDRINAITNSSREYQNAVSKAEDYLDYTAFSKSGLRDQLIFEQFPEDAAQFAVDHIVVNWNEQALLKAQDYLDYSSFSNQGLYDQLLFEGFSESEAQYALDNLPK